MQVCNFRGIIIRVQKSWGLYTSTLRFILKYQENRRIRIALSEKPHFEHVKLESKSAAVHPGTRISQSAPLMPSFLSFHDCDKSRNSCHYGGSCRNISTIMRSIKCICTFRLHIWAFYLTLLWRISYAAAIWSPDLRHHWQSTELDGGWNVSEKRIF